MPTAQSPLGWLGVYSEANLRAALRSATPDLADLPITLHRLPDLDNANWASCRATVGARVFAKFAFSERTAVRIWREAQVLGVLDADLGLAVPKLVAANRNPAFVATELVDGGVPLTYADVVAAVPDRVAGLATHLASFLARLHAPHALARLREEVDSLLPLPQQGLHVSTEQLRARFIAMIEPRQRAMVGRWCDWVDGQLATSAETVFVHGDLHPYNQLWDLEEARLLAVIDFEGSGVAEPEFDFRVLPVFGQGVDLLVSTVERYEALTARKVSLSRVMAHHLLNYLGDALWRTEAGLPLPEPGDSPSAYVAEASVRMAALGISP